MLVGEMEKLVLDSHRCTLESESLTLSAPAGQTSHRMHQHRAKSILSNCLLGGTLPSSNKVVINRV